MNWSEIAYVPQFRWKAGERAAMANFDDSWATRVLPLFRLLPPGGFEADLKVTLSDERFLKRFGRHLADVRGRFPTLLDGELLESVVATNGSMHPFGELLERARLAGATPIPVFRRESGLEYRAAIKRYLSWSDSGVACVRVTLDELEAAAKREDLLSIAGLVDAQLGRCLLLIDAGPLAKVDEEGFSHLLAYQFSRLIQPKDWALVIFSSTTFPDAPKIAAWESAAFDRTDWLLYRHMVTAREEFSVFPVFSDYGLDYPKYTVSKAFQPTAHLRYSTENKYFIFKGRSVKFEDGYANIFRVADRLVNSGIFKGGEYSKGDAYINLLSSGKGKTGHASKWRWCSTDHHLTLVLRQLGSLLNIQLDIETPQVEPDQLQLILS